MILKNLNVRLIGILLLLSLTIPTGYKLIKLCFLVIVFGGVTLRYGLTKRFFLSKKITFGIFFYMLIGLLYIFYGAARSNLGAGPAVTVYFLWIGLYPTVYSEIKSEKDLDFIYKMLVLSSYIIPIYCLLYLLKTLGIVPFFYELDMYHSIGIYGSMIEISISSLSSLLFLLPYLCYRVILRINKNFIYELIALMLNIGVALIAGRRALILSFLMTPPVFLFFYSFLPKKYKIENSKRLKKIVVLFFISSLIALGIMVISFNLDIYKIYNNFIRGFNFDDVYNESAYLRRLQFFSLMEDWSKRPLFGHGLGASGSMIRSVDQPWAYELTYVALLFQTGIIGFIIYSYSIIWILKEGIKIIKKGTSYSLKIIPILVGMISFLIANVTNPYLFKFDYLWIVLLPVSIINIWKLKEKKENMNEDFRYSDSKLEF